MSCAAGDESCLISDAMREVRDGKEGGRVVGGKIADQGACAVARLRNRSQDSPAHLCRSRAKGSTGGFGGRRPRRMKNDKEGFAGFDRVLRSEAKVEAMDCEVAPGRRGVYGWAEQLGNSLAARFCASL
jgi:hypothetical protein